MRYFRLSNPLKSVAVSQNWVVVTASLFDSALLTLGGRLVLFKAYYEENLKSHKLPNIFPFLLDMIKGTSNHLTNINKMPMGLYLLRNADFKPLIACVHFKSLSTPDAH